MIVLGVLAGSLLLIRAAGALGVTVLASWVASTRWALAVMFTFAGVAHFTRIRHPMARMVPPVFGNAMAIVYFTGVCEILASVRVVLAQT